jgi:chemotaxis protein methyltransferase CheR
MDPFDGAAATGLSRKSFDRFARYITQELGIKMPDTKLTMVQSRLLRRVRELRLDSVEQYGEYFFSDGNSEERIHFIDAITTNKTDFFREPEHFDYLVKTALPALAGPLEGCFYRLNVWSAGCSSGEEPYTLAMILSEYANQRRGFDFSILATDISNRVLEHARAGIYDESLIGPVPLEFRKKYLLHSHDRSQPQVRMVPKLRQKTSFHRLNFMADDYGIQDMFEVIFFRNVMIYFDKSTQERVVNRMCRNLQPGGYLFVGHSESLAGLDIPLTPVHTSVFRKPAMVEGRRPRA